jgi:RNA polymerase sigma-70 factor (ECF subfamily)
LDDASGRTDRRRGARLSETVINDREEDPGVVAAFIARDASALEKVYGAYRTRLYAIARHVLGNDEDAQDCVHDALMRVWQRAGSYRPERGPLRTFLMACVRNEALTRKRDATRHLRIEEQLARAEAPAYEFEVADTRERDRLRRALAELPPEQRAALDLAYFEQLTHVQVAQHLGEPLGTVKGRLRLALAKLSAALS